LVTVARIAAKNPRDIRVLEWNIFGALDLIAAVFLAMTSLNGGPSNSFTRASDRGK
jgi:hypothetical protein